MFDNEMRVSHERHRTCRFFFGDTKGVASDPYAFAHSPPGKRARNNRKKAKTSKFTVVNKVAKTRKRGNNRKIVKINGNKSKKRQSKKNSTKQNLSQAKEQQRSRQNQQKTVSHGNFCHEKTCNKQKGKIAMNKMSKRKH